VQQLDAIAFPKLDDEQMAKLGRYVGVSPKKLRAGEALFRCGDRGSSFFVINSGGGRADR
jgi:CRP-like cAMP-binding protein